MPQQAQNGDPDLLDLLLRILGPAGGVVTREESGGDTIGPSDSLVPLSVQRAFTPREGSPLSALFSLLSSAGGAQSMAAGPLVTRGRGAVEGVKKGAQAAQSTRRGGSAAKRVGLDRDHVGELLAKIEREQHPPVTPREVLKYIVGAPAVGGAVGASAETIEGARATEEDEITNIFRRLGAMLSGGPSGRSTREDD